MAMASGGETVGPTPWRWLRAAGAVLATLSAVPYALLVLAVPVNLVVPQVVREVGLSSTATLSRTTTAATCGLLLAGVLAAGAVGRRVPAHLVSLAGLVVLTAAALWMPSVSSLAGLALARAGQGVGAGAVLVATLATAAWSGPRSGRLVAGAWGLAAVVTTAVAPWATYRLPFLPAEGWRAVLAPYPWLLALALAGTAVIVLTSLGPDRTAEVAGRPETSGEEAAHVPPDGPELADGQAGRLGWPLLLPAGIAVAASLIRPSSTGGMVTLESLVLGTALVIPAVSGLVLSRSAGWQWGAAPPVVAAAAAVLTVTATHAFTLALLDGAGHWPLTTSHVLPALGGAALGGGLATIAGLACPTRSRRTLTVAGLALAAVGSFPPLAGGIAATAVGAVVVWVGVGLAVGAVLRVTGPAAAGWLGAGFAVVGALAAAHDSALRTAFTARAVAGGGSDATSFLRTGFVDSARVWVVVCGVLLAVVAVLVARMDRRPPVSGASGSGAPSADSDADTRPGERTEPNAVPSDRA